MADTFSPPSESHTGIRYAEFLAKLKDCADGRRFPFTLVISDPLSNSFVGPRERRLLDRYKLTRKTTLAVLTSTSIKE